MVSSKQIVFAISFLAICTMAIVSIRSSLPTENHDEKPIVIPAGMALVPSGEFIYGSDDEDADDDVKPARRISLPGFLIDLHEVTNREYQKYDPNHAFLPGEEDLPATGVLYNEAEAYAKSAGKRLPTDEEWEKATRGTDGRRYPWGNTWDAGKVAARAKGDKSKLVLTKRANLCRVGPSRVSRTGTHPEGNSPYGCVDMAGNAWEWVQGYYQGNKDQRILRGGAVGYGERACRAYNRGIEGSGST